MTESPRTNEHLFRATNRSPGTKRRPSATRRMSMAALVFRGLVHYRWVYSAVLLGVATGTAVLTGSLFVGDSMRESLRTAALARLGPVEHAMVAQRYFRESLAGEILSEGDSLAIPLILLTGGAVHAETAARATRVQVLGVDDRFWIRIGGNIPPPHPAGRTEIASRTVVLNRALADSLRAAVGDEVLLSVPSQNAVSAETLLGRRDRPVVTLRLAISAILANEGPGDFSLSSGHETPRTAFVPLETLQRSVDQRRNVNGILFARRSADEPLPWTADEIQERLKRAVLPEDLGLKVRTDAKRGYFSVESVRILLEPAAEEATTKALRTAGAPEVLILTYLANEIALLHASTEGDEHPRESQGRTIPYSTVTALSRFPGSGFELIDGRRVSDLRPGEIYLNEWAASELESRTGDRIQLVFYITDRHGELGVRSADFTLAGIVKMSFAASDPGLAPTYPGVTDVESIAAWDAPFPVDLKQVKPRDEDYWNRYRAAPKGFIELTEGMRLWATDADRFGRLSAIRGEPGGDNEILHDPARIIQQLKQELDPAAFGLVVSAARGQAEASSKGTTDFGGLFVGFSFFLIASAAMLVALLFRLSVERRSRDAGLLLAMGFAHHRVRRLFMLEGSCIAVLGVLLGLAGALAYSRLMLAGLRSLWSAAAQAPSLIAAASPTNALAGVLMGWLVATAAIAWSLRGLLQCSARALLQSSGVAITPILRQRGVRSLGFGIGGILVAGLVLLLARNGEPGVQALGFFSGGALLLVAAVTLGSTLLPFLVRGPIVHAGVIAMGKLATRNASRQPRRSRLTLGLIASATFLILALQAFRIDPSQEPSGRQSGTGGFAMFAESSAPILADLNASEVRETHGLSQDGSETFSVVSLRLSDGDETSCLNLYAPGRPRILGAPPALIEHGGFRFASSLAETPEESANPWLLLRRTFDDGAVAAMGDEAAVRWQLHSGLGKEFAFIDDSGREIRLRFVALLRGSILQSELIVSEESFGRLFPSETGYRFFLIEGPPNNVATIEALLERAFSRFGLDVARSSERLAAYAAVQNTYLSTFQLLGGLGLILGTIGLSAVMLRNVWERRRELALLRAVGYSRWTIGSIVLLENLALVVLGILAGILPAMIAVLPQLRNDPAQVPVAPVVALLAAVFLTGLFSGALALVPALRAPLVQSLRSE
jgi:putative ABC transport system permease protein